MGHQIHGRGGGSSVGDRTNPYPITSIAKFNTKINNYSYSNSERHLSWSDLVAKANIDDIPGLRSPIPLRLKESGKLDDTFGKETRFRGAL